MASLGTLMPAWFAASKPPAPALSTTVRAVSTASIPAMATNEWIVQLNDQALKTIQTVPQASKALDNPGLGLAVVRGLGLPGQLLVSATGSAASAKTFLQTSPLVKYVEANSRTYSIQKVPDDPRFTNGELWGLDNTGQAGGTADADIDAPEAWDISTGSSSVVVAVIDTGIQYDHPDLKDNIWMNPGEIPGDGLDNDGNGFKDDVYGWDFDNNDATVYDGTFDDHGTHVAGTIAGSGNNGTGVVGVGWNTKIMSLKFLGPFGGTTAGAIAAVNYATMMRSRGVNIPITSNSWGGGPANQALKSAIEAGGNAGVLFVAAAGNGGWDGVGDNNDSLPSYPAAYDSSCIVAVAATDRRDRLASFSNYGLTSVDLAAPGVAIVSTVPSSTYDSYDGTSMATPHVSGVAALAMAVDPTLTVSQLKESLLASVDKIPSLAGKTVTGGRLNARNTLEFVQPSLKLLSVTPSGKVTAPVSSIVANFNEQILSSAVVASNFSLKGDGLDGIFGTSDDVTVTFANANVRQTSAGVVTIALPSPLTTTERYVLTVKGTGANPLRNLKGRALGQWGTSTTGQDVVKTFMVRNFAEPNDTLADATVVPGASGRIAIDGTIGDGSYASRDVDLYKVTLAAGQPLVVDIDAKSLPDGSSLDAFVRVFDTNGKPLTFNDDDASTDSYLRFTATADGTYYVGVSGFGNSGYDPLIGGSSRTGSVGDYTLALTFGPTSAALSAVITPITPDPRDTAVESITITFNRPVQGFDLADLELTRAGSVISLTGASLAAANDRSMWTLTGRALQEATNATGSYRFAVKAAGSGIADVTGLPLLTAASDDWQTTLPAPPPTPPSTDAGDVLTKAREVSSSTAISAIIGDGAYAARDVDLYRVILAAGQQLVVDIDAQSRTPKSTLDSVVRVFDADGRPLAANDNDVRPGFVSRDSYLTFKAPRAGTFYVGISGFGNASYDATQAATGRKAGSVGAYVANMTLGQTTPSAASLASALAFAALTDAPATAGKKRIAS